MKRFAWRLQRVLDIKTKEEQTKKAQLVKLAEKLAQSRSELLAQMRILDNIIYDLTEQKPKRRLGKQEFFLRCSTINDKTIEKLKKKVRHVLEKKSVRMLTNLLKK